MHVFNFHATFSKLLTVSFEDYMHVHLYMYMYMYRYIQLPVMLQYNHSLLFTTYFLTISSVNFTGKMHNLCPSGSYLTFSFGMFCASVSNAIS